MSLLHPALLWAAPAAGLPILAHLLSPKSLRVVPFAPIALLSPTLVRHRGRHRLHGLVLLALRIALFAALVLLCAHPVAPEPITIGANLPAALPGHGVLVVDASASMNFRVGQGTLLAAAKDMATRYVSEAPAGDAWALVVLAGGEARQQPLMTDAQTVRQAIARSIPAHGDGTADLARGIEQASKLLDDAHVQGSIVVISDLSRTSLPGGLPAAKASHPEGLPPIVWLDAAARAPGALTPLNNLAITDLEVRPGVGIEVVLHNFGASAVEGRGLTVRLEGGDSLRGLASVPAGATVHKLFALGAQHSGAAVVQAHLDPVGHEADGYAADDQLSQTLTFAPPIHVLAVDGAPHSRARASELFYAERALALAPRTLGAITTTVVPRAELLQTLMAKDGMRTWDVVVLANVGRLTAPEGQALLQARRRGVGLILGLGDSLVLESDQDAQAYRAFLPLELRDVAHHPLRAAAFSTLALNHPVLAHLGEAAVASLRRVRTSQYLFVAPEAGQDNSVVIAYDDGAPALIEVPSKGDLGAVLLWTSTLDADWTTLPLTGVYVPLLQRMVVHAAQRAPQASQDSAEAQARRGLLLESDFTPLAPAVLAQGRGALKHPQGGVLDKSVGRSTEWVMPLASLIWLLVLAEAVGVASKLPQRRRQRSTP